MNEQGLEITFGGQAGDGSLTTGDLIAKIFARMGYEVYTYKDFPSRIRGGHTNYVIRASRERDRGIADHLDGLVAFDLEAVEEHLADIRSGGFAIFDSSDGPLPEALRRPEITWYELPLGRIAKVELGLELVRNTLALGVLAGLVAMDPTLAREEVGRVYARKGERVVEANLRALDRGLGAGRELAAGRPSGHRLRVRKTAPRLLMMGNDAIAYGALVAGCRFIAGYPITPATDILEWLAARLPEFGGLAVQAEDELAAINMALGAAYAGVRAMTATSGPGQSLMTEGIGLAGMLEIPLVVVECARAGPSTGMPTKTEQSNLAHLIFGGHGEIPKIVLAPGSVEDAFYLTAEAFSLAERFQCPVFVLTEQALAQSKATLAPLDLERVRIERGALVTGGTLPAGYRRYAIGDGDGSPRAIPGVAGGMHLAAGSEHDEAGVVSENAASRRAMMEKRMRKLERARSVVPPPRLHGDPAASVALLGYGSVCGPVREALAQLERAGTPCAFLELRTLWPFPDEAVRALVDRATAVFVVEQNYSGQLERLVRAVVGPLEKLGAIRSYDGRPLRPGHIREPILHHDRLRVPAEIRRR
ncbi:MAG: 2-oxoacid:acceptor oxidoreductase subunit alpha [Vulcanimicrobiaceae bacterium]